ncbi:MAG: hypothetical protein FAF03_12115 [Epsilonproteobacteria bacterium]|nr:hypothetical protein [Campylobacterota bacterium]
MGTVNATEKTVEKLIVSSSKDKSVAEESLLKLKVYLLENVSTRKLQDKYPLDVKMEHFSQYDAVVISPPIIHYNQIPRDLVVKSLCYFIDACCKHLNNSQSMTLNEQSVFSLLLDNLSKPIEFRSD